jgi:Fe-Mn family superoxide dismutase
MTQLQRREFIASAGLVAGAALAGVPAHAQAQTTSTNPGAVMTHTPKPLPFDPQKIKGMSEKLLVSHHENNYAGAVKRLNAIQEQLAALDFEKAPVFTVNGLKREELIAMNSMLLHELFFDGLGESSAPEGALAEALTRDFGSVAWWRA